MKAVVMAGGDGSRLRPLTIGRPKPLVPIVNKSVMGHILDLLKSHQITEVVVTLRYMASAIQDYFDDGSSIGMKIRYAIEETPLGTAGSVRNAAQFLDETFIVISGDALTDFDLSNIIAMHQQRQAKATLTLKRVANPLEYGVVITDSEGWVTSFQEKPGWGELSSDTVNTGIYVLEPELLDLIPPDTSYDFSLDLFPRLLADGTAMLGYVAEGYWCDVGNIEEYMRANSDMLHGRIRTAEPIGTNIGGNIYCGRDVEIAPGAQLFGPIYLGDEVKVKDGVRIYGPTVVRDYSIVDNYTLIERSIIWRNNYVGENCEIRGAIIGRRTSTKARVMIFEGAVIGDNCTLGENSIIHTNVKLWPDKEVEAGATVHDSIIWGSKGRRALFGRFGATGVVNVDLTPEFCAKLGAAVGATLPKGSYVAINRDAHRSSRMLKRALVSGLPGSGVNVWDTESVAIPVWRHFVRSQERSSAGIHVRLSPFDQRTVDIRIIDHNGLNLTTARERTIERNFFREDFRRAYLDEIGTIDYARQPITAYVSDFLKHVDVETIRNARFRMVVDYSFGLAAEVLSSIFNQLGVDVVPLNARVDESKLAILEEGFRANQQRMGKIVEALGANLGVQLDVGGEKIYLVDEKGRTLSDITTAAVMMELALLVNPGRMVMAPITAPNAFETITQWHKSPLVRTGISVQGLSNPNNGDYPLLACDGTGNFIFPEFQPNVDGMFATAKLMEYLAKRQLTISAIVDYLPPIHMAGGIVNCPWEMRGMIMRQLNEQHQDLPIDKLDGVKIHLGDNQWVHLSPHPDKPQFNIMAEANSISDAQQLVLSYIQKVEEWIQL